MLHTHPPLSSSPFRNQLNVKDTSSLRNLIVNTKYVPVVICGGNVDLEIAYLAVETGRVNIILGCQLIRAWSIASNIVICLHDPEADKGRRGLNERPAGSLQAGSAQLSINRESERERKPTSPIICVPKRTTRGLVTLYVPEGK